MSRSDPRLMVAVRGTAPWLASQAVVRRVYRRRFESEVSPDPDFFVSVTDAQAGVLACCGLTHWAGRPLLAQSYLQQPVEELVARHFDRVLIGAELVELGSLISFQKRATRLLMQAVPWVASAHGARWALLTADDEVQRQITLWTGAQCVPVEVASASAVSGSPWGRYYDQLPRVCLVDLQQWRQLDLVLPAGRAPVSDEASAASLAGTVGRVTR